MSSDTSIRVIHVSPTAFGHDGLFGGGERYPVELVKALARLDGVRCELVTFGRRASVVDDDGVRVRVLRSRGHLHGHPAHPLAPSLFGATRGADVVHVHHLRSTPSRLCAVMAAASGTPVAVTDHGLAGGNWLGLLPRLFDRFLTVSQYSSDVLASPPEKTTVIYGGADPERFFPDSGPRDGVLFVGRLTPHKGVDRAILALPAGARLSVVGTGGHDGDLPERGYVTDLRGLAAGKDVHFLGAVGDAELAALYRRAAVVVDGVTGYLVEPGDVGGLRARLDMLLDDPVGARRLGTAGRARALEHFTWRACAQRCLDAYRAMVSRAARGSRRRRLATPTRGR